MPATAEIHGSILKRTEAENHEQRRGPVRHFVISLSAVAVPSTNKMVIHQSARLVRLEPAHLRVCGPCGQFALRPPKDRRRTCTDNHCTVFRGADVEIVSESGCWVGWLPSSFAAGCGSDKGKAGQSPGAAMHSARRGV